MPGWAIINRQGDSPVYKIVVVEWRQGAKWLAPSIAVDGLDAMRAMARQLARALDVESFYVFGPAGCIRPEMLWRLTGVSGV
jgi:hypothetical protein